MNKFIISKLLIALLYGWSIPCQAKQFVALDWLGTPGGIYEETLNDVITDAAGNIYITGTFRGKVDFDPGSGAADTFFLTSGGFKDIFVSKLNAQGKLLWVKQMGSPNSGTYTSNSGEAIDVDIDGNIYITGYFQSTADFDPGTGAADTFFLRTYERRYQNIFVSKLDKDGKFVWARQFTSYAQGQYGYDIGSAIAVDKQSGNVYITGKFTDKADFNPSPLPADTFMLTSSGGGSDPDIFIASLDKDGRFNWAKGIGGSLPDQGNGIAVDRWGNVLVTGHFYNKANFNPGTHPSDTFFLHSANNSMDIFVCKYSRSGNLIWAKKMGAGNGLGDAGNAIATDTSGNVYTTGFFAGVDAEFNPGSGSYTFDSKGRLDIFVSKLDSAGNFVWAKQMGGDATNGEQGYAIRVNNDGHILVSGGFNGTVDFNTEGEAQTATSKGALDAFLVMLNQDGDFRWVKTYGGTGNDVLSAIAFDQSGSIIAGGNYSDTVFVEGKAYGTKGERDMFVLKYSCAGLGIDIVERESVLHTTEAYASYQWYLEGVAIDGATNRDYTASENGNYTVVATNSYGCRDTSDIYIRTTSIKDGEEPGINIRIYPNPVQDKIQIISPVSINALLFTIEGKQILSEVDITVLSLKELNKGIYLLRITDQQGRLIRVEKVVKQ